MKKVLLEISQNSQEKPCATVSFFNKVATLSLQLYQKKETLAQVFSCEICEISSHDSPFAKYLIRRKFKS